MLHAHFFSDDHGLIFRVLVVLIKMTPCPNARSIAASTVDEGFALVAVGFHGLGDRVDIFIR